MNQSASFLPEDFVVETRERRTGYAWYGDWPRALLDRDYPPWQARQARAAAR